MMKQRIWLALSNLIMIVKSKFGYYSLTMKYPIILLLLLGSISLNAQNNPGCLNQYRKIASLIINDKAKELSGLLVYPIKRSNPLPDIKSKEEFIKLFPSLFDRSFKTQLQKITEEDLIDRNNGCGLFAGDLWINEEGKIIAINYESVAEQQRYNDILHKVKKTIHPSLSNFNSNILVWRSGKLTVRVDEVNGNFRYAAWSKGKPMSALPDMVLNNGVQEFQGTAGGVTYTFRNNDWTYIVDQVDLCETEENCGKFIRILQGAEEKYKFRCLEVK